MALNIPHSYATKIELVAQEQQITCDGALDQILQAGLAQLAPPEVEINVSLWITLWGGQEWLWFT